MKRKRCHTPTSSTRLIAPRRYLVAAAALAFLGLIPALCWSAGVDMGDSLIRDYPVALTLPKHRLEVSIDYLYLDEGFGVHGGDDDSPGGDGSDAGLSLDLESLSGFRSLINYGLTPKTTVMGGAWLEQLDYGDFDIDLKRFDISVKRNLTNRMHGRWPFLAVDAGLRLHSADISQGRFDQMDDLTPFLRLTAGKIYGRFFPNLFVEYGHPTIDTTVHREPGPDSPSEDVDLGRSEDYLRSGFCLLWKRPYILMARFEYNYLRLFREDGLSQYEDNHIIRTDLNIFPAERLILTFGSQYSHRQLNGLVPLLYNEYTQKDFDSGYLRFHVGITILFGG